MSEKVELGKAIETLNTHIVEWADKNNLGVTVLLHNSTTGAPVGFVSSEKGQLKIARLVADALAQILFQAERAKSAVTRALS